MDKKKVVIIKTGVANMASIIAGLERAGAEVSLAQTKQEIADAKFVILPGVGAFAAGMEMLRQNLMIETIQTHIATGKPFLAVCLGLQLLFEASEESPGTEGLSIFPGRIERFPNTVRVPQLGWNKVLADRECTMLQEGYAYFANSYRLVACPEGCVPAQTNHGGQFISAFEKGSLLACQFHPELSGSWGIALLQRWLQSEELRLCDEQSKRSDNQQC